MKTRNYFDKPRIPERFLILRKTSTWPKKKRKRERRRTQQNAHGVKKKQAKANEWRRIV